MWMLYFALTSVWASSTSVYGIPIGVNLPPLGGRDLGGSDYASINWNPVSTNIFIDMYKHCSPLYIRSTSNGGITFNYVANTAVSWRSDLYPASLPYVSASSFYAALCDIGLGGSNIRNGSYSISWSGSGTVDVSGSNVKNYIKSGSQSATVQFNVRPGSTNGVTVRILSSSASDPVFGVHIVPKEFATNYTTQSFHPSFLNIIKPFNHIRFTGWQKAMNSVTWSGRTLPSFQTQILPGGVALEHMIDLVTVTGVKSVWFSFPLLSTDYNSNMITFLAQNLPSGVTIYYESGSPEYHGDNNRYSEFTTISTQFDNVFNNLANVGRTDNPIFYLMPTASVNDFQYVSYLLSWYGSAGMQKLRCVAVPGVFGRSASHWDNYDGGGQWSIAFGNYSESALLDVVRSSVLSAEVNLNNMIQNLQASNSQLQIVSYKSGPFFSASTYGYRAGRQSVTNCARNNQFPCKWANTRYDFADQVSLDLAMNAINYNCSLEQQVENNLILVQRNSKIYDIYLDFIRRWEAIGGGLMIGSNLVQPALTCPTGGKGCGNPGMFEDPLFPNCVDSKKCAKYFGLVDYANGLRSALPYTAEEDASLVVTLPVCSNCTWGTCVRDNVCKCYSGYSGRFCDQLLSSKHTDCNQDVGLNLASMADWSPEWTFVDISKSSRDWISQDFTSYVWNRNTEQFVDSRTNYPTKLLRNQKLGSMMIRDLKGHIPRGVYVCRYDGDGIISFSMDVVNVTRSVGRIEVTVSPTSGLNNGLFLTIERTNPEDPIRNIRVFMPGFENYPIPFHPLYLKAIKHYKVFRFMDWALTNSVLTSNWSDRNQINISRTYSMKSGVPIEYMIQLSNMVGTSPWFNMPHLCNDDFVYNFAKLVKNTLRPDLKIYIEYSNEVWGTLFPGGQYAQQQGLLQGLASDATIARFCFYVKRSSEIFAIWKDVFDATSDSARLEFVYSSQAVQPAVSEYMLQCSAKLKLRQNATALAIAPYFGSYVSSTDLNLTVFMTTTLSNQISSLSAATQLHSYWASKYNLNLLTYESGQGLAGSGSSTDLAIQANRDIRMSSLYVKYFEMLRSANVKLMMHFSSVSKYTYSQTWGLLESTDQVLASSPKFYGLLSYMKMHTTCDLSEFQLNENTSSLCSYNGVFDDIQNSCLCYFGFSGSQCEVSYYNEHKDLCGYYCNFNQGVCVPDKVIGSDRYWKCSCINNYYGDQCTLFDCQDSCNYNGLCIDRDICSCYVGYSGQFCGTDCKCNGHGICGVDPSDSSSQCVCDLGYEWDSSVGCKESCASDSCLAPARSNECVNSCKYGVCYNEECSCFAGASGDHCEILGDGKTHRPNQYSGVGTNLGGIAYWMTEWVFVDVMKMSSEWISLDLPGLRSGGAWGNGQTIHLRDDGYPKYLLEGQMLVKLMLRDVHRHAPSGRYVCLFDGEGEVDFSFDAKTVTIGKNRVEFEFTSTWSDGCTSSYCGDNGILLMVKRTNVNNPVRNIRVIMPGFESVADVMPFHPWFIESIQHYKVLRFMDWQATNNNNYTVKWTDRPLPTHASQSKGVALEHMVQLSNLIGASPWFCMPHQASDSYVSNFSSFVKSSLRPDIEIYVEYSNEVWNGLFLQGAYAQTEGLALGLSTEKYTAQYRFYAKRSVEIFNIWKATFAGTNVKVNYVLSAFTASPWATSKMLSWNNAYQSATYLGVAPYFDCGGLGSPSKAAKTALMTVSEVISACNSSIRTDVVSMVRAIKSTAASYGLDMITYESGQALVENAVMEYGNSETSGLTNLLISVNRNDQMKTLYELYISVLNNEGVMGGSRNTPLIHFSSCGTPTKYGSWGAIEYTGQSVATAPKYAALKTLFNQSTTCENIVSNTVNVYSHLFKIGGAAVENVLNGFPSVTSPKNGDVWVSGRNQLVQWATNGISPANAYLANLYIVEVNKCDSLTSDNLKIVHEIASNINLASGSYSFLLPLTVSFSINSTYMIEIRGNLTSIFSEYFHIQSQYYLSDVNYICCMGTLKATFSKCWESEIEPYQNRLRNVSDWSAVVNTGSSCSLSSFSAWKVQSCTVDTYGCRQYRTSYNSVYGNFKPVVDCVAKKQIYSKLYSNEVPWNNNVVGGIPLDTMDNCVSLYGQYPSIPDSCEITSGIDDARCYDKPPTFAPTLSPSAVPSKIPTRSPSVRPSRNPSSSPSQPSRFPTKVPTSAPSRKPSNFPTKAPSRNPTFVPSRLPTHNPTSRPSRFPRSVPTARPSAAPSSAPSRLPSVSPSFRPSQPSAFPSTTPTRRPTRFPSRRPSLRPA